MSKNDDINKHSLEKAKISFFKVFVLSIFHAVIFVIGTYYWFTAMLIMKFDKHSLLLIFLAVFFVLLVIIFMVIGFSLSHNIITRNTEKRFDKFKTFTDSLHHTNNEKEIYTIMFDALKKNYPGSRIAIYYTTLNSIEEAQWENIANSKLPLCNMQHRRCPAVTMSTECFVNDISEDVTCAYQLSHKSKGSYVCLSINLGNSVNAVLQIYNKNKFFFTKEINTNLYAYIDVIKRVLEGRKTIMHLNKEAYTDKLTQVYNRSFFDQTLAEQFELSTNNQGEFSLIIIDIDFFKKINDNYGHTAGDKILQIFAQKVVTSVRKQDIVARFGGEEFVVVLPSANISLAKSIAERIREGIQSLQMPIFEGKMLPSVTCSLGVSNFPTIALTKNAVLKTADMALYNAKNSGRNKVSVFTKKLLSKK